MIDYAYPEDKIFERDVAAPQGNGLTLDISASYQWHNHEINLDIGESFSDLYWNTAPGSRIEGNINRLTSSDEATVRFSHFRTRFHQRLPVHTQASYRYQFHARFGAGVNYEKLDTKEWLKWAANWHIDEQWTGSLLWSAEDDLVGFELTHPNFLFALESDDTDYRKSHYLKLQLLARLLF